MTPKEYLRRGFEKTYVLGFTKIFDEAKTDSS